MDILLKVLLSSTLIYVIHFIFKTFTANNFDKLFMLKHQIYLQNTFLFTLLFVVLMAYIVFIAAILDKIKDVKYFDVVITFLYIVYFLGLFIILLLCLIKRKKNKLKFSGKVADFLSFTAFLLHIVVFSFLLHKMVFIDRNLSGVASLILLFCILTYLILKSTLYLQGISRREWDYVLSPTPIDIQEKYLYVLYSLNANTLVLSDDPSNKKNPRNIYLFDLNKSSYTYFNRVVNLKKDDNFF